MQSSKHYNEVRNCKDETKHPLANFETYMQNRFELAPPHALFTFEHPNHAKVIDNTELSFNITADAVGGYFECYLYKDIMISIIPLKDSQYSPHVPGLGLRAVAHDAKGQGVRSGGGHVTQVGGGREQIFVLITRLAIKVGDNFTILNLKGRVQKIGEF